MPPVRNRTGTTTADPPAPSTTRITLADLNADDRRELLEAAREEAKHNPTDVPGYEDLSDREKAIRGLMDARDHSRGCPVQTGTTLGRVEGFDGTRPPNPAIGRPAAELGIVRCMECGGQTVLDTTLNVAVAAALDGDVEDDE